MRLILEVQQASKDLGRIGAARLDLTDEIDGLSVVLTPGSAASAAAMPARTAKAAAALAYSGS